MGTMAERKRQRRTKAVYTAALSDEDNDNDTNFDKR
jgi:hypothetical protein